jgi:hypothetical protein
MGLILLKFFSELLAVGLEDPGPPFHPVWYLGSRVDHIRLFVYFCCGDLVWNGKKWPK